eukprot:scaffold24631_cov60-Phaeocystis_antarctica.AAC.4
MARTPRCPPPLRYTSGTRRRCRRRTRRESPPARAHFHIRLARSAAHAAAAAASFPAAVRLSARPLCVPRGRGKSPGRWQGRLSDRESLELEACRCQAQWRGRRSQRRRPWS